MVKPFRHLVGDLPPERHLSTLRTDVEAPGGPLEIRVRCPDPDVRLAPLPPRGASLPGERQR